MADSLIDHNTPADPTSERAELLNKWKDKSKEEILAAKVESDLFIKTQNARFDDIRSDYLKLREESQAKASLEELIARQEKLLTNPEIIPDTHRDDVNQPSLKPEDIDSLLEQKLSAREQLRKETDNLNIVKAKLKEQFGDNVSTVLKQRMDTLGLDQAFTDELAKKHPSVFMKTFGLDQQVRQDGFNPPPRSIQRQDSFAPKIQRRDWNYYQELKKSNPRLYLDPKISVQMHQDALEQGDAFGMPKD